MRATAFAKCTAFSKSTPKCSTCYLEIKTKAQKHPTFPSNRLTFYYFFYNCCEVSKLTCVFSLSKRFYFLLQPFSVAITLNTESVEVSAPTPVPTQTVHQFVIPTALMVASVLQVNAWFGIRLSFTY